MELSPADIKLIMSTLQESGYDEAEVVVGDVRIAVSRGGGLPAASAAAVPGPVLAAPASAGPAASAPVSAAPGSVAPAAALPAVAGAPAAASAAAPAPASAPEAGDTQVTAPSVGVFWHAPEPGAAPFVKVGSRVEAGDTVGIVEVMKLMTVITTKVAGIVTAVHVENAAGVEFGTPLVSIRPEN